MSHKPSFRNILEKKKNSTKRDHQKAQTKDSLLGFLSFCCCLISALPAKSDLSKNNKLIGEFATERKK